MAATHVSPFKVALAIEALTEDPSLTGPQFAEKIDCCLGTATEALRRGREHIATRSRNLAERGLRLRYTRAEEAIEAMERQIAERLQILRGNAEKIQALAEESGERDDILAANRAWEMLTKYERTITGIDIEEKKQAKESGTRKREEMQLQIPLDPDSLGFG